MHFNLFTDLEPSLHQLYSIIKQENTSFKLKYKNSMTNMKIAHYPFIKIAKKSAPK